jgi:hypothetical protein
MYDFKFYQACMGANITSLHCSWPIPFFNDRLTWVWVYQTHQSQWLFIPFMFDCKEYEPNLLTISFIFQWNSWKLTPMNLWLEMWYSSELGLRPRWKYMVWTHTLFTCLILFWWIFTLRQQNKVWCHSYKGFCWEKMAPSCHILRKKIWICQI